MAKFIYKWGPVFLWAGLIFTLSSLSTLPTPEIIWWDALLKKSAHVIEYATLYFLLVRALSITNPKKIFPTQVSNQTWILAFVIALGYAISDELHQSFTPGRYPKVTDVIIDTGGMILSMLGISSRLKNSQR